jgi:hypothetical protein
MQQPSFSINPDNGLTTRSTRTRFSAARFTAPVNAGVRKRMDRIAASFVRWGAATTVLLVVGLFAGWNWLTEAADSAQTDSVGVGLGLALLSGVAVIISSSLAGVGALGLWYVALFSRRTDGNRYENERVIGTALLLVCVLMTALMWSAF